MGTENFPGEDGKARNAKAETQRQDERRREIRDFRKLLRQPEFRRFCWRKLAETGIFRASFNLNTKLEDFQEGRRDIGLALLLELNEADGNAFAQMQREAVSEALSKPTAKEETSDGE